MPRRAFTVADITRMMDAGVLGEDERFELIEGDLVTMAAKPIGHDRIKHALTMALARAAPEEVFVVIEASLQLANDILVEPDITVVARSVYRADRRSFAQPRPQDILLLIEVAVSSLAYDREVKARLYARHGVRDYWVIDAAQSVTWVHSDPQVGSYASVVARGPDEALTCDCLPALSMRLADID
ncbi:MAG: Uma2 family endonuclease [Hyphomicrobiales bacterium]|nr:Uma2 family endonuclease [Hyphomicrobiales bacterium]